MVSILLLVSCYEQSRTMITRNIGTQNITRILHRIDLVFTDLIAKKAEF